MRPTPPDASASRDAGVAAVTPREPDDDAGPPGAAALSCDADAGWQLAAGFVLSQHVDYVEDRAEGRVPPRLSSAGVACATAKDKTSCQASLALQTSLGRVLVTTTGDDVRFWSGQAAFTLLGLIDTEAEALWVASQNYELPCKATVKRVADGFVVDGLLGFVVKCMTPDSKPLQEQVLSGKVYPDSRFELLTPSDPAMTACTNAF
jgi:hypothetical protein